MRGTVLAELSPVEWAVLQAVALYRFVNVELLHRVVPARRGTIRNATRKLYRLHLVGSTGEDRAADRAAPVELGSPHLFWLSVKGETFMHRHGIAWAIGATRDPSTEREVEHRLGVVAVHIAFRAWAATTGKRDVSFLTEFEPGSTLRKKITGIPYTVTLPTPAGMQDKEKLYVPDALARFRLAPLDAPQQLLVIEFERGGRRGDLSKFFGRRRGPRPTGGKLAGIRFAADHFLVEQAKGQTRRCPYLVVFGGENTRAKALEDWPDKTAAVWERFFISSLPRLEAAGTDFSGAWCHPNGTPRTLFAARPGAAESLAVDLAPR